MKKIVFVLGLVVVLAGCSSEPVLPGGARDDKCGGVAGVEMQKDGTLTNYSWQRCPFEGSTGKIQAAKLVEDLTADATEYCKTNGKKFELVSADHTDGVRFSSWTEDSRHVNKDASANIYFNCR